MCSGLPALRIIYTQSYIQRAQKFARRHPDLLGQYEKTMKLLEANPSHPSLHLHKLTDKLDDLYHVSMIRPDAIEADSNMLTCLEQRCEQSPRSFSRSR